MSRTQGYTWEEVLLNIDVKNEAERERQQQQDILDEQAAEEGWMKAWSLGLSLVGGALFGPAGYAAGKIIGRHGADYFHDWEDMEVDAGKFYKDEAEEFKRTRDKAAADQDSGQILQAFTDLAMMYVQAGGLQEGPTDLTTFGSGEDAWSVFGKGEAALPAIQTSAVGPSEFGNVADIMPGVPASPDYVPSLFSEWKKGEGFLKNIKPIGKKLKSANTDISTLNTLYQSWLSGEEEKAAS